MVPITRDEHSANVYNEDSMIIFGGFVNGSRTNEVYRFHFNSKRWEKLTPKTKNEPPARAAHSCVVYNDKLVVFGGKDEDNEKLNDVWAFDLELMTWEMYQSNSPGE